MLKGHPHVRLVLYSGPINNHNAMRRRLSASQPYKIVFVDFAFGVGIAFQDVTTADKLASCLSHTSLASLALAITYSRMPERLIPPLPLVVTKLERPLLCVIHLKERSTFGI